MRLHIIELGRQDYQAARDLQRELAAKRLAGEIGDTLLLLEHPPVITLGRAAHREHLLFVPEELEREGFAVVESDRGGDVTYHGPGQLVGYPILNLQEPPHHADLHAYLRLMESALIRTLIGFGITADRFSGYTGVWVKQESSQPEKIAAIGIKVSRWITQHGFALNVDPDLGHFDRIVPCGIHDYGVTSMTRLLGRCISLPEVIPPLIAAFRVEFGYRD